MKNRVKQRENRRLYGKHPQKATSTFTMTNSEKVGAGQISTAKDPDSGPGSRVRKRRFQKGN